MERSYGSGSRNDFGGPKPPVSQGEVLEVVIEAVGEKGDGIARKDGFVLFIPGVKEGDRVKVKVTRVLRKVGFAEVVGEGAESTPAEAQEAAPVAEPEPEPEPEPSAEDTEDFGEEVTEEVTEEVEEAPVEEPEAPAEDIEAPEPPKE
ncbi:TRAM domain-containing protein [Candidatus Woesearchaeota archaeon]|nr:TRAM domain-containing protein [Candidatus Woesearchaeota archaeon]MBW2994184.1 TRAM domain-containing protein [Candidatus Woesearchaeota archaeon]